jgi:divalent metal cation (Fe/Co/Zn/Cd) transporter
MRISICSLIWTVTAGSGAIAIGILGNNLTLVVFGVIGLLDGVGSGTLIAHFRHALRHDSVSSRHERLTLLVVSWGMAVVGVATIADSIYRLRAEVHSNPLPAGIGLAAVSVLVLAALAVGKRRIAPRIPSHALGADGWLSATGALLAVVTLAGTALDKAFNWWWSDPVAAILVAVAAIGLSITLIRRPVDAD